MAPPFDRSWYCHMYVLHIPLNHLTSITLHSNSYIQSINCVNLLPHTCATDTQVKLCLPMCSPPSYLIIPSFSTPSLQSFTHSLVLLPQLYSLSLRVSSLLSDWRARLQLCMSETRLLSSYLPFPCFYFLFLTYSLSLHQMPDIPNSIHRYMFHFPRSICRHNVVSVLLFVDLQSDLASVFWVFFFTVPCFGCLGVVCALLQAAVENIMKEKMPKKGGRWWFSWRGRNSSAKSVICPVLRTLGIFLSMSMLK